MYNDRLVACYAFRSRNKAKAKMPMEFLDRLPIPNLRVYTAISFAVLSCSVYYAAEIIKDPAWKSNHTYVDTETESPTGDVESDPRNFAIHFKELLECMLDEPICIWVSDTNFKDRSYVDCSHSSFNTFVRKLKLSTLTV